MECQHRMAKLARIFVSEDDRYKGERLYERLLFAAKEMGLAGATVIRGVEGFGASGAFHSSGQLRTSEDLPMIVSVVDSRERLEPFVEQAEAMLDAVGCGGLITLEDAEVILHLPKSSRSDE